MFKTKYKLNYKNRCSGLFNANKSPQTGYASAYLFS